MGLLVFKSLHLIAMVAWFAGLFYMFRLFVYHVEQKSSEAVVATLTTMERRLFRVITVPAMVVTLVCGLTMLIWVPLYLTQLWLQLKLVCILLLVVYTIYIGRVRMRFASGDIYLTSRQCRMRNELPTPLLIIIILLAVFRPV